MSWLAVLRLKFQVLLQIVGNSSHDELFISIVDALGVDLAHAHKLSEHS
ncbi:hypothetical protein [Marinoscillum luteum]|uniref:Uncharacterized protein n=1 Tax=Marinoscillum luteum TaxID=861051 RepID=A0ABW7N5G1_9BACT